MLSITNRSILTSFKKTNAKHPEYLEWLQFCTYILCCHGAYCGCLCTVRILVLQYRYCNAELSSMNCKISVSEIKLVVCYNQIWLFCSLFSSESIETNSSSLDGHCTHSNVWYFKLIHIKVRGVDTWQVFRTHKTTLVNWKEEQNKLKCMW